MKTKLPVLLLLTLLSAINHPLSTSAQGTAFTYQGRLAAGGSAATGIYDLRFTIYDSLSGGSAVGAALTNAATGVSNGLFAVTLDFGGVFDGSARWLEIAARTNGTGAFTTLTPRQALTATPYAVMAGDAGNLLGTLPASQLSGTIAPARLPAAVVTNNAAGLTLSGTFTGNGAGVSNVNASTLGGLAATNFWQLGGNNVRPGQFLGSTNYEAVEIKVNNVRALRLEPRANTFMYSNMVSQVGGSPSNSIGPAIIYGSVIAGGGGSYIGVYGPNAISGHVSFIGAGAGNSIWDGANFSVLGGGYSNSILANANHAVLGGGEQNTLAAYRAFLGGGFSNSIQASAQHAVLVGGTGNSIHALDYHSALVGGAYNWIGGNSGWCFLGGGDDNAILTNGHFSVLGGGRGNVISGVQYAFLGGGVSNRVSGTGAVVAGGGYDGVTFNGNTASGAGSAVSGGTQNLASGSRSAVGGGHNNSATNSYATVPGGAWNVAGGQGSLAAGRAAKSLHDGSFVWNDATAGDFASTGANQFLVHASGVGINTNNPQSALHVNGTVTAAGFVGSGAGLTSLNATNVTGNLAGNGAGLTNLNASQLAAGTVPDARLAASVARTSQVWLLSGNAGTTAGQFLGTTDNRALELKVNGLRALRLEPTTNAASVNLVGGSPSNSIASGVFGSVIAGGGGYYIGDIYENTILGDFSIVGAGCGNTIRENAPCSFLGGGFGNLIESYTTHSLLGGGHNNFIRTGAHASVVAGGGLNQVGAQCAFIGGGYGNTIGMYATDSFLGGGAGNLIRTNAAHSFLGGGTSNTVSGAGAVLVGGGFDGSSTNGNTASGAGSAIVGGTQNLASGSRSTIGGGHNNSATNWYATVPGGAWNVAGGQSSFAAGQTARAIHDGALVWGDASTLSNVQSTNANSVTMRASGGYRLFSNNGLSSGVFLAANGTSWSTLSDRSAKKNFAAVDGAAVLEKLAAVPIQQWNYKWEADDATPNLGPTAQDFKAAFYPGRDDKSITTLEYDGVALAAIQGLNSKLEATRAENAELKTRLERLERLLAERSGSVR